MKWSAGAAEIAPFIIADEIISAATRAA